MPTLRRLLEALGLRHREGRVPLFNPDLPPKQLWTFVGMFALFGTVLVILHHTVAPWL